MRPSRAIPLAVAVLATASAACAPRPAPCEDECVAEFLEPASVADTMLRTPGGDFRFEVGSADVPFGVEAAEVSLEASYDDGGSWSSAGAVEVIQGPPSYVSDNAIGLRVFELPNGPTTVRAAFTDLQGVVYRTPGRQLQMLSLPTPVGRAHKRAGEDGSVVVTFDGSRSTDGDGQDGVRTWTWTFGDGGQGTGETVTHTYTRPGTYMVVLCVTDQNGQTAYKYYRLQIDEDDGDDPTDTPPPVVFGEEMDEWPSCRALSMTVAHAQGTAFSPQYPSKKSGTLGVNNGFALNPVPVDKYLGYGFEVITRIEGNPEKCYEWQELKRTSQIGNLTAHFKGAPIGGAPGRDRLRDGIVPTGSGTFPLTEGAHGLDPYLAPANAKVHLPGEIRWRDTPGTRTGFAVGPFPGYEYIGDFIAFVGGTKGNGTPGTGNRNPAQEASCHFRLIVRINRNGITTQGTLIKIQDADHNKCAYNP